MKRLLLLLAPVAVLAMATASCSQLAVAAATVNGEKISSAQVERELDRVRSDPTFQDLVRRQADQVRGFARRQILSGLIRQEILAQQAQKLHIRVTKAQMTRLLSDEAARSGLSVPKFLKQQNLTQKDADQLAERVVREFELKSIVARDVAVDGKQVQAFYNANKAAFEQVHLARITARTQADATAVIGQLASGQSFADIARARSVDPAAPGGGDLGYVSTSSLPADAQAAITQVKSSGITTPIQGSAGGFEIYRVLDRRVQSLADVEGQIRNQIGGQAQDTTFETWVKNHLTSSRIVVNPEYGRFDRATLEVVAGSGQLPQ
jgi:peptidyl-prolyl cis-trans isomerase C